MWHDVRYALRTLRHAPGFALVAVISLALGIGANAAISSLIYQVAVRALPVRDPGQLFALHSDSYSFGWTRRDNNESVFSYPMYLALRDRNQVFSGLIARVSFPATLASRGAASSATAELVSGNFFAVLGVSPALGRLLLPADDAAGHDPVIVLSYAYWMRRLGGDPTVLNSRILVNSHPVLVVGVAPAGFRSLLSGRDPDFFAPLSMTPMVATAWKRDKLPDAYWLSLFGRIKPGIGERQADAMLLPLFRAIVEDELPQFSDVTQDDRKKLLAKTLTVAPAAQGINILRSQWQTPLLVLMAMTGAVLLIACANVANLLIARAAARQREIAIRLAIGATRFQLFRQLLAECMVLAMAGGLAGMLVAQALAQGLVSLLPADATSGWLSAQLDWRVLGYSLGLSAITGAIFGVAPALQAAGGDVASTLKAQGSGLASGGQSRFRRGLVAAQICFSMLLLIGAGLFTRTLFNLLSNDPGFQADRLVSFSINPSFSGYSRERTLGLFRELRERLAHLPGVTSAASSQFMPFGGWGWGNGVKAPGSRNAADKYVDCQEDSVSPGYFRLLAIPVLAGREFAPSDTSNSQKVAILNRTFAKFLFENESPVGRHLITGSNEADVEIVGVVADSKYNGVREAPSRFLYIPYEQGEADLTHQAAFFARTAGDEKSVMGAITGLVKQLDSNLPVERLTSMKLLIRDTVQTERLMAILAAAFGTLAAILAAVGLYGTIAYVVTRRTREFGIRMALGAVRASILVLVLGEVGWLLAIGLAAGVPASYALARLVESQLFGVHAHDPWVLLGAALLMALVALAAGLMPATRAMRVEPVRALKHE